MIRFSAALVVVAIGVLIAGVATSSLSLVYVAIGISAVALLVLAVGVALKRDELFRDDVRPAPAVDSVTAGQPAGGDQQDAGSEASSRVPVSTAGGAFGSAFSRGDSPRENNLWGVQGPGDDAPARPGRSFPDSTFPDKGAQPAASPRDWASGRPDTGRPDSSTPEAAPQGTPARPSAWPAPDAGFPAAPAAKEVAPPAGRSGTRRPAAPPTRADPVVPWAASMPTRVDIAKGKSSDPGPSWLEDVDDKSAASAAAPLAGRVAPVAAGAPQDADAPAAAKDTPDAAEDSQADARGGVAADDEPAATWGDAPRSWDDSSWKADAPDAGGDSGEDVPAAVATASETDVRDVDASSAGDDATHSGPEHGGTTMDDSQAVGTVVAGADDDADEGQAGPDEAVLDEAVLDEAGPDEAGPDEAQVPAGAQAVAVVPGVPRYHEPNCILIRFMPGDDIQRMTVSEAEEAGCTPCRACQPE